MGRPKTAPEVKKNKGDIQKTQRAESCTGN